MAYLYKPCGTLKAHIATPVTTVTAGAWTTFSGFTINAAETLGGVAELNADTQTVDILQDGLYQIAGCLNYINNSGGIFANLLVLGRIFVNGATEPRCLQTGTNRPAFANGAQDTLKYLGTEDFKSGDSFVLQYYTDQAGVSFEGNTNFDNPVSATIWLVRCGDLE